MLAYPNWGVESFSYCPPTRWLPQPRYDGYSPPLTTCRLPIIVYNNPAPIKCEEPHNREVVPQQPRQLNTQHRQLTQQLTQEPRQLLAEQPSPSPSEQIECEWSQCDLVFGDVARLSGHVARDHSHPALDGLFYCRWSGCLRTHKGFNARYKMLVHVRTHTNEKPHVCSECNKSFSRAENLKIHKRSHSGERPYVCSIEGCEKAYSNSSDRFKHMRTHAVEKPYACKVAGCFKRYTDPSSLRKHVKAYKHYTENSQPTKSPNNSVIRHVSDTSNDRLQPLECANNVYKAETKIFRPFSSDIEVPRKSCIQELTSYRKYSSDDSMSSSVECRKCSQEPSFVHSQTMTFSMNPYSIEPVYERIHPMEDSIEFQLLKNMELPLDLSTKS